MEPFFRVQISDERAAKVINEISVGSEPELRFYAMVAASTAIATFGLVSNSTAVVIGAMLVAPLMTPIFGIALALIRGDATLLGRAVRAEIVGVLITVTLAACFGFLIVAAFLSKGLYEMVQTRQLKGSIDATLTEELSHLSATELRKVVYQKHQGKLFVLAHVHASGDITPSRV